MKRRIFLSTRRKTNKEENSFRKKSLLQNILKISLMLITLAICSLFYMTKNPDVSDSIISSIQAGKKWTNEDLKADFTFQIPKSDIELKKEKEKIQSKSDVVFQKDNFAPDSAKLIARKILRTLPLDKLEDKDKIIENIESYLVDKILDLPVKRRRELVNRMTKEILIFLNKVYKTGVINLPIEDISLKYVIIHIPPKDDIYIKKETLFDKNKFVNEFKHTVKIKFKSAYHPFLDFIFAKLFIPNYNFSDVFTQNRTERELSNIPVTKEIIHKTTLLIAKGDVINDYQHRVLKNYYNTAQLSSNTGSKILTILGNIGHTFVLLILVFLYLIFLRRDIWNNTYQVSLILFVLVFAEFLAWLTMQIDISFPIEYIITLPALILVVVICIDARSAIVVAMVSSLLIAGIRNNDYIIGTTYLIASGLTAYSIKNVQIRVQMFQSIFIILLGFAIPIIIFGIEINAEGDFLLSRITASSINAIISPLIALVILIFLDKTRIIRHFNTDIDLRQYDNKNHPLLEKLNEKAPGTYKHSMAVADLVERCAIAIGANPILARVGAYYHDIGKMSKPDFFIENSSDDANKHNEITSFKQSANIIKSHVSEGIRIAEEYKLPQKIIDFIPAHHGTSLIQHFYAMAKKEHPNVNPDTYSYTGPKPTKKEHAILMLCDAAEAISRIRDKTAEEIEAIILTSISAKIDDNQLSEADITFKEIDTIIHIIVKHILGANHSRTSYKEIPDGK